MTWTWPSWAAVSRACSRPSPPDASAYIRRGHDPGATRARPALMQLGEAAGAAAALAVRDGVAPRRLDVRRLQRHLLQQGFHLGEPDRLTELGLTDS